MDFKEHFAKYEALVSIIDGIFEKVKSEYPKEVSCREKCSDCCYAIFDIPLIEAIYLNHKFREKFSGTEKSALIDQAARVDRALFKMKRDAHKAVQAGGEELEILATMSQERMRCPLLGEDNLCILYESRPITCRIYGIPTATAGKSHICGSTNFEQGGKYPTVNMDALYAQLQLISAELTAAVKAENVKVCEMLIPVSMALLTDFNEEFFGMKKMDNFTDEEIAARKKAIFDAMGKRGQKQIMNKVGYDKWDPIQTPKDPIDIRMDGTKRTSQMLISQFLQQTSHDDYSNSFAQGAFEMCLGIINNDEKIRGMFEFSNWYSQLLKKEGQTLK